MSTQPARYIMVGGFLGAGKTTAVARLAAHFIGQGLRVGLITNDQGSELVDTTMLRSRGFATEEISGGCFCCRFNSLVQAAQKLTRDQAPDVFIAEPVGSCTDLIATVSYPLRRLYGAAFTIAPLSVLVDPIRALRILGLEQGGSFSEKVLYIYRKQLEEADLIVINKRDLIDAARLAALRQKLTETFPAAIVLDVSARSGDHLENWFARLASAEQSARTAMSVDYETYAEGEALLGWLNATVRARGDAPFDGNELLQKLTAHVQSHLQSGGGEVAHLKMTLTADEGLGDTAVINLVRNDYRPELSQEMADRVASAELIVNIRAEIAPERLSAALDCALADTRADLPDVTMALEHHESFRPGKPMPTYRVTAG